MVANDTLLPKPLNSRGTALGTIGLTMADKAGKVVGIEIVEAAVKDAIANAALNNITNAGS